MKKRILIGIGIVTLVLCVTIFSAATQAAIVVCERCELIDLPWEPGLSGLCLDLNYSWGWKWCLDGSFPGQYCLLSNDYCDAGGTDEPPEL